PTVRLYMELMDFVVFIDSRRTFATYHPNFSFSRFPRMEHICLPIDEGRPLSWLLTRPTNFELKLYFLLLPMRGSACPDTDCYKYSVQWPDSSHHFYSLIFRPNSRRLVSLSFKTPPTGHAPRPQQLRHAPVGHHAELALKRFKEKIKASVEGLQSSW